MRDQLDKIGKETLEQVNASQNLEALEKIRISVLGKKGALSAVLRGMGSVSAAERPKIGAAANEWKQKIESALESRRDALENQQLDQKIQIYKFTETDIDQYFKNKDISKERLSELQLITGRNLGRIKQLIQQDLDELCFFEEFVEWMRIIYKTDLIKITKWCNEISFKNKQEQLLFITYSIKTIRQCLYFNFSTQKLAFASKKEQGFIEKFAKFIHKDNIFMIVAELEKSYYYLKRNANTKIVFYSISLKMLKYLKLKRKFVDKQQIK